MGFILVTMCFLWLCGAPLGICQRGTPECPYLSVGTAITEDIIREGCGGRKAIICKYLVHIQRYRGKASQLLTHICHKYGRSQPQCAWLGSVQANNRHMIGQLYNSLEKLTTITEVNIKIDTLMKEQLFQYLGSRSSEKLFFFSFMDTLMQPLEYKLSTIEAFVAEGHSEQLPFMERLGIRRIIGQSVQNLIQLLSDFDTNFTISFNEIHEERSMASFYLKMFSVNVSLSDTDILINPSHSEYEATYSRYRHRAEKYPKTWAEVLRMISSALHNDIDTAESLWIPNEHTILHRTKISRQTDGFDIYQTTLLRSALDGYPDPDVFRLKLYSIFPFTLKGVHWIKNTSKAIEEKEIDIMRLAKEEHWLGVQFKMYILINTYSAFVKNLDDFHTGLIAENRTSESTVQGLSESCTSGFQDLLDILQGIWHTITGPHATEQYGTFTLHELQEIRNQTNGFQNPNIVINQESKLLPWITFAFNLERLEDWLKSRLFLYEELLSHSDEKQSVSNMMDTLAVYICQYGGTSVTLDTVVSTEDILCTLSTVRLDCLDYDSYPLEELREKCGSSTHRSTTLCSETVHQRKEVLFEQEVRTAVGVQGVDDPVFISDSIYNKIKHDAMSRQYGLSVSKFDILHTVARLYPERQQFGFYQLSFFQQNHRSLSEDILEIMSSFAVDQRNANMANMFRTHFCNNHGFCVEYQSSVHNFTSEQVYEGSHVVLGKDYTPLTSDRVQANDQAPLAPVVHVNIFTLFVLLVCHFVKQEIL